MTAKTTTEHVARISRSLQRRRPISYFADCSCGYHGLRYVYEERDRAERDRDGHVIQARQSDYVAAWRAEHPAEVWAKPWHCPLCGYTVQETVEQAGIRLQAIIEDHHYQHGESWSAYEALARQPEEGA